MRHNSDNKRPYSDANRRMGLLRPNTPSATALFIAGLCTAYLLLPLTHHLIGTDDYFYISNRDNFFAQSAAIQLLAWLIAAGIALLLTQLRRKYARINQ